MKKMTIGIITLTLLAGFQTRAYCGDSHRRGRHFDYRNDSGSIQLVKGPMTVEFRHIKRQKRRHCFPARMKVWINGSLTKVQITVCKKPKGWVASPVHIDMGRNKAVRWNKKRRAKQQPVYDKWHNHENHDDPFSNYQPVMDPRFSWYSR